MSKYIFNIHALGEETSNEIASLLYYARTEKNYSLSQAAKLSGVSLSTIDAYEMACRHIDFEELAALLKLYGIGLNAGYQEVFPGLPDEYYDLYFGGNNCRY